MSLIVNPNGTICVLNASETHLVKQVTYGGRVRLWNMGACLLVMPSGYVYSLACLVYNLLKILYADDSKFSYADDFGLYDGTSCDFASFRTQAQCVHHTRVLVHPLIFRIVANALRAQISQFLLVKRFV